MIYTKKIAYSLIVILAILMISGCSRKAEEVKKNLEQPLEDAADYIPKEVDLNKKMQSDIQSATDKENERLQKILDGSSTNNQ